VLSIRASDTEADPGVLPTAEEQQEFGACIVRIAGSRHNDMYDGGVALNARMTRTDPALREPRGGRQTAVRMQSGIIAGITLILGIVRTSGFESGYDFYSENIRSTCHENPRTSQDPDGRVFA
jgi:hypothetical protein